MNRQQRRSYLGAIDKLCDKIVRSGPSWEERWNMFSGCLKGFIEMGQRDNHRPEEISAEIGGILASRLITAIGEEPVDAMHQALLYFMSSVPAHRDVSVAWQRAHPEEMLAFAAAISRNGPVAEGRG
jgi:hypothetical protein